MYFVIHGYCSPDHYTSKDGPVLEVREFTNAAAVEKLYREFLEETSGEYTDQQVFRVIKGEELKLKPKQVVTEWELGK